MEKPAPSPYPLAPIIARRWSPRAFDSRPVARETLQVLIEAARWSSSCFNDQPWNFIVAAREDTATYDKLFNCLVPANQVWAQAAPVLMLVVARQQFRHDGSPNQWAAYDCGQAMATLVLQALDLGLFAHQMGGFVAATAIASFGIPEGFTPIAAVAIGYPGDISHLPPDLQERERAPRSRRPATEFTFGSTWGQPASFLDA